MATGENENRWRRTVLRWMGGGMIFGIAFGVSIGATTKQLGLWLPVGMVMGMCFGLAIGTALEKKEKK